MVRPNILIVDDESIIRDSCHQVLSPKYNVKLAEDGSTALSLVQKELFDVVILDIKMPGISGMEVLKKIKETNPDTIVIVITGYATIESAVESMKLGAYDFLPKPFTPDELRIIVERAIKKRELITENIYLRETLMSTIGSMEIIGDSPSMRRIKELIIKVGPTDSTILISGESGTGKELVARAIHQHSDRNNKPFVAVDCGTLVESLFESELFGHVKGAFTGATTTKYGRFELANGGTIFFDEIGNIGTHIQSKLLRVLQEREITRVGGAQVIKIDIRIITATNKNLLDEVKEGRFRDDLFYRLNVVPINIPPLRDRKDDILLLANYFLQKYNRKRLKNIQAISNLAMKLLLDYNWPGNVRELENTIERAVVLTKDNILQPTDISYYPISTYDYNRNDITQLDAVEKEHILRIFKLCNGCKSKAAQLLGIDRKTLRKKLEKYKI